MTSPSSLPRESALNAYPRRRVPASVQSDLAPARQPFLYLTTALVIGILVDRRLALWLGFTLPLTVAFITLAIWFIIRRRNLAATLVLLASFAMVGAMLSRTERTSVDESRLKRLFDAQLITPDDPVELTGVLIMPPEPAPQARYLDVEAESLRAGDETRAVTGSVRLMIQLADDDVKREFRELALDYGSQVRVLVRLERARSYSNPGSPDFTDFLERRGYDLKGVIKSPLLIAQLGRAPVNPVLAGLYHLRLRMMDAMDARFSPRVAGTLKAMLSGNRYFLDAATIERLREGATFHTLVIAGLHIGIIAWVLLGISNAWRVVGGVRGFKLRRVLQVVLPLVVLWAYAVMVGLAPPVTRAAAMITVGLIGPLIFRRAASINTVALAAFTMLALKPSLVTDPGFQLSFVAVASIVTLALPLIDRLRHLGKWQPGARTPHPPRCSRFVKALAETLFWDARRFDREMTRTPIRYRMHKARAARWLSILRLQPIIRGVGLLMITSTAIQLATLPLMALYFNRVSPVGVLLNVVAGLLTMILMLAGLAAILFAPVSTGLAGLSVWLVNVAHNLLVNAIVPFVDIPVATFRVAHYEGGRAIIYALYFVPLALLAVLIDRWRPVDQVYPVDRSERDAATRRGGDAAMAATTPLANDYRTRVAASLRLRVAASLCLLAFVVMLIAVTCPPVASSKGKLTIHFLDVGQGDAALIVFPHGSTMLVDGGGELRFDRQTDNQNSGKSIPASQEKTDGHAGKDDEVNEVRYQDSPFSIGEEVVSRFLWSQGRTRIDYVLATHADADHIDGLADVVRNFSTGQALVGHAPIDDAEFDHFIEAIRKPPVSLASLSAGERFEIEGVTIEVLWPPRAVGETITSGNDDSVVLRLVYGSVAVLLVGDIEQAAETALARSGFDLRADVLKVPHHGSKTSSTDAFLDRVHPRDAVISVGERSRFGHPHKVVVERYQSRGVRLHQTGRDGTVTVQTDGTFLDVSTYRNYPAR
jgi:competence protein ComEC